MHDVFKTYEESLFTACSLLLLASCSEYQEALKSDDMGVKYNMADSLYNAGKYTKAIKLWDQVVPNYKGKPQAERVMFLYADTYYRAGDYYLSGYQFDRFATSYPQSEKIQEAKFKAAKVITSFLHPMTLIKTRHRKH